MEFNESISKKEEMGKPSVILKQVFPFILTIIPYNHQKKLLDGLV